MMCETRMSGDALLDHVREVAGQLDTDLQQARDLSAGWTDAVRTDPLVHGALQRALDRLAATGCWGEANRLPSSELWRLAGAWLEKGDLQRHARFKPRGYAGDFEMFEKICTGYQCADPLGAAFDRFFQSQAAPEAVRRRTVMLGDAVVQRVRACDADPLHVVTVGSGPALDIRRACTVLDADERRRLQVTLLDLDPTALDRARSQLHPFLADRQLRCVRENLSRLSKPGRGSAALAGADWLACPGLFDYLDDAAAAAMLTLFWQALRPGGRAWVFNFAPHNPSRAYMEWIGNWYLTYRTADQMRAVAQETPLPPEMVTIHAESSGVNLCWEIAR